MDINGDFMEIQEGYFSLEIQSDDDFHDLHGNMTESHGINLMRMQWGYNGMSWNVILCKLHFLHPISIPGFWWGFVWRFNMMGVFGISFMGINVSSG